MRYISLTTEEVPPTNQAVIFDSTSSVEHAVLQSRAYGDSVFILVPQGMDSLLNRKVTVHLRL